MRTCDHDNTHALPRHAVKLLSGDVGGYTRYPGRTDRSTGDSREVFSRRFVKGPTFIAMQPTGAEYPLAMRRDLSIDKLPAKARQGIYDADWEQYQTWLNGPSTHS